MRAVVGGGDGTASALASQRVLWVLYWDPAKGFTVGIRYLSCWCSTAAAIFGNRNFRQLRFLNLGQLRAKEYIRHSIPC